MFSVILRTVRVVYIINLHCTWTYEYYHNRIFHKCEIMNTISQMLYLIIIFQYF